MYVCVKNKLSFLIKCYKEIFVTHVRSTKLITYKQWIDWMHIRNTISLTQNIYRLALKAAWAENLHKLIEVNQNYPRFLIGTVARLTKKKIDNHHPNWIFQHCLVAMKNLPNYVTFCFIQKFSILSSTSLKSEGPTEEKKTHGWIDEYYVCA